MKKRILISGLGGSLFPYLHTKFVSSGYDLFYVDSNPILKYVYPDFNFFLAPLVSSTEYKAFIVELCHVNQIDYYLPLIDEELILANEIGDEISRLKVLCPQVDFVRLCLDKHELMESLSKANISTNPTYKGSRFNWQFEPPVFVKPNIGRGSRGIKKIDRKEQLEAFYILEDYSPSEIIVQPFIKGSEYTVGVVTNPENKILSISAKRALQKKGITTSAVTENNSIIEALAVEINEFYKPRGPFNIQLFLTEDQQPVIFEINPRFSTTLVLSYEAGLPEVSLLIDNYNKKEVEVSKAIEGIYLYRQWNSLFYKP